MGICFLLLIVPWKRNRKGTLTTPSMICKMLRRYIHNIHWSTKRWKWCHWPNVVKVIFLEFPWPRLVCRCWGWFLISDCRRDDSSSGVWLFLDDDWRQYGDVVVLAHRPRALAFGGVTAYRYAPVRYFNVICNMQRTHYSTDIMSVCYNSPSRQVIYRGRKIEINNNGYEIKCDVTST